ncbi:oxygen-dependent coproporphyrinogen oxidase [Pacificimonas sp. WHA3]|uniref:Oxygen-dependent coproporphyrinogen oxidase n=1 Tax=Pacificimonas pallii TaxID=2827236 RepID=A0ABS6SD60_9SPHN|nr:oxygen-dependent coproporphyrinogen oxidase [Pacificimonas pallii]MBV7255841.1 oxygen-dependent coproporphyrinogen oxidase [Pacificimonas pallii]
MTDLSIRKTLASDWFAIIRDRICTEFECLEDEAAHLPGDPGRFERKAWDREDSSGAPGGGGVMSIMKGRLFEKVGVNISTVSGTFEPEFAKTIPGAAEDPRFFATGVSLVAHMVNPHVPAVHMNTRYLATTQDWFGGGSDLNPPIPRDDDTADWHRDWQACCARHDVADGEAFRKWCDEYFYVPHRNRARGVGGIFYDRLSSDDTQGGWDADFAFTKDVGETFIAAYAPLVRRRMSIPWTDEDRAEQLRYRGLYTEFNLIHDRGTLFGLKTGGNIEAILMSLPPLAAWE